MGADIWTPEIMQLVGGGVGALLIGIAALVGWHEKRRMRNGDPMRSDPMSIDLSPVLEKQDQQERNARERHGELMKRLQALDDRLHTRFDGWRDGRRS